MDPSSSLRKTILFLLLIFSPLSSSYSDLFESWCREHGRSYASEEEKLARFRAFEDNRAFVTEHNAAANSSYTLALNTFADLTHHEFRAARLGLSPRLAMPWSNRTAFRGFAGDVPDTTDWRKKGAVTHVKDQSSSGIVSLASRKGQEGTEDPHVERRQHGLRSGHLGLRAHEGLPPHEGLVQDGRRVSIQAGS